jgi:hypothetical protein
MNRPWLHCSASLWCFSGNEDCLDGLRQQRKAKSKFTRFCHAHALRSVATPVLVIEGIFSREAEKKLFKSRIIAYSLLQQTLFPG